MPKSRALDHMDVPVAKNNIFYEDSLAYITCLKRAEIYISCVFELNRVTGPMSAILGRGLGAIQLTTDL